MQFTGEAYMNRNSNSDGENAPRAPFRRIVGAGALVGAASGAVFSLAITLPDAVHESIAFPSVHGEGFDLVVFALVVSLPIGLFIGMIGACAGGLLLIGTARLGMAVFAQRAIASVGVAIVTFLAAAVTGPIFLQLNVVLFSLIIAVFAAGAFATLDWVWRRTRNRGALS